MTRQEQSRRYYLKHKEKILEKVRIYREENREKIREKDRIKYSLQSEKSKEYQKKYRQENKDKINAYHRKYYTTIGREKHNEIKRKWAKTDKGKLLSQNKHYRRRALLKNIGSHSHEEWLLVVDKQKGLCNICKEQKKLTKDHIIPLTKGGMNTIDNIQGLCLPCNARKGNK